MRCTSTDCKFHSIFSSGHCGAGIFKYCGQKSIVCDTCTWEHEGNEPKNCKLYSSESPCYKIREVQS